MWSEERIIEYLSKNLKKKRYDHSLSVRDTAVKMAQVFGADINKARICGLVHDCAKNMSDEEICSLVIKRGQKIDKVSMKSPQLMHGMAGAIIAEEIMGINDNEILNAVIYHTTGKENMTLLDKIIYIADYVEPLRNFPGVEDLREYAYKNLNTALLKCFDSTIKFVVEKGQLLHMNTIIGRNYIISEDSR